MLGYVTRPRSNALAASRSSREFTPTNVTPLAFVASYVFCRSGASARHGLHHEPQKLTTTTLPRSWAASYVPPPSSSPVTSRAWARWSGRHWTTPWAFVVHFFSQLSPPQPASTPAAT